jgi:CubicO group peptidase (beta-lactamase class C family)
LSLQTFIFPYQAVMKRILKITALVLSVIFIMALSYALYYMPGVMTGMDAKVMCSCVYVAGRTPETVKARELHVFPGLTLADITITPEDSSVSARLLWKKSTAIYRKGLGCTLIAEQSEEEVRNQMIRRPHLRDPKEQDSISWPMGNRLDPDSIPGLNYQVLDEAIGYAFTDIDPENAMHTHAVVVLYDGKLVGERYAEGFNYNSRHMGWSMTKSIGNALIGILVKDGRIRVDDPAPIQEWQTDERRAITINHLLQASSGLQWNERYFLPTSEFHEMFIRRDDKAGFAASLDLEYSPGTFFEYSSGSSNVLSRIVRQELGDDEYYQLPYTRLFQKIGMYTALLEPDASGTFVTSSYCFASARDWARFGLLYLNDGMFNNERILPEGWVKYSTAPAPAAPNRKYGAQVWLNLGSTENASDRFVPGVPSDAYLFEGFEKNSVTIIPSQKLVVVRLGVTHNKSFQLSELVTRVMNALPK